MIPSSNCFSYLSLLLVFPEHSPQLSNHLLSTEKRCIFLATPPQTPSETIPISPHTGRRRSECCCLLFLSFPRGGLLPPLLLPPLPRSCHASVEIPTLEEEEEEEEEESHRRRERRRSGALALLKRPTAALSPARPNRRGKGEGAESVRLGASP